MGLFIAFDLESTGVDPWYHEAIEIGAVVLDPATFLPTNETFHRRMNPEKSERITPGVMGVKNHWNEEVWKANAVTQYQGWVDFSDWVHKVGGNGVQRAILVGHNILKFDYPMMETWNRALAIKTNVSYHPEDTLYQYITIVTQLLGESVGKSNLGEVCGYWGVGFNKDKAHSAFYDAFAAGACYAIGRAYARVLVDCGRHSHAVLLNEAYRRIGWKTDVAPLPTR